MDRLINATILKVFDVIANKFIFSFIKMENEQKNLAPDYSGLPYTPIHRNKELSHHKKENVGTQGNCVEPCEQSAPFEILTGFLTSIMTKDYKTALKQCEIIMTYEPDNVTVKEFHPLILEKLKAEEESKNNEEPSAVESSEGSDSTEDTSSQESTGVQASKSTTDQSDESTTQSSGEGTTTTSSSTEISETCTS